MVKMVETRKDPNKPWYELTGLSPQESSTRSKSRTECTKRCGWFSDCLDFIRQSSLKRVHLANVISADLKDSRNRDTISFHMVPPKGPPEKTKCWGFAQESLRYL